MGLLDTLRSWFASESAEARSLAGETRGRLEAELDRREAKLAASPEEKLDIIQGRIAEGETAFDALRDKIEGREARAEAVDELLGEADDVAGADDTAGPAHDTAGPAGDEAGTSG
jgi:phage shock protein A